MSLSVESGPVLNPILINKAIMTSKAKNILLSLTIVLSIASVTAVFKRFTNVRASISPCVLNLLNVQRAKGWWMRGNERAISDTPTWNDLKEYIESSGGWYGLYNGIPHCPDGGTYTINRVGEPSTCSVGGPDHSLKSDMSIP